MRFIRTGILFLLAVLQLHSESYVREYAYNAGENDSKATARKAALDAVKVELIQEVGVTVMSSLEKETTVRGDEAKTMIRSNLATFSVAMTKTEILDEKWDGEKFWVKVRMEVDPDTMKNQVKKSIKEETAKREVAAQAPVREAVYHGLMNLRTPERIRAVTSKAVTLPLIGEENIKMHRIVMEFFGTYGVQDDLYREFLFTTLSGFVPDNWKDKRGQMIFEYLAKGRMYDDKERGVLIGFFARLPEHSAQWYYRDFFAPAEKAGEAALTALADAYLGEIAAGKVGRPMPVTIQDELKTVLDKLPEGVAAAMKAKYQGGRP